MEERGEFATIFFVLLLKNLNNLNFASNFSFMKSYKLTIDSISYAFLVANMNFFMNKNYSTKCCSNFAMRKRWCLVKAKK